MRPRTIAVVLAAATLGVAAPGAEAKPKGDPPKQEKRTKLVNEFRVEYDATVTWNLHSSFADWNETAGLSYTVKGTLPNVSFVQGALSTGISRRIDTTVEGSASIERVHPSGTSATCSGKSVKVDGLAGIGRASKGIWFAPWVSAVGLGSCTDTDGGTPPLTLQVGWPAPKEMPEFVVPAGAQEYVLPAHRMDTDRWSEPFRISFQDDKCPNYDPSRTIGCSYVLAGTLTLTRVSRKEEEDDSSLDALLGPVDPPKLDRKKTKVKTRVECQKDCDIEALIGVFGGTPKRPKVSPIRSKKQRLKANKATTISIPLNAQARAAAKQGRLVMTLKVKGGKRRIYPVI